MDNILDLLGDLEYAIEEKNPNFLPNNVDEFLIPIKRMVDPEETNTIKICSAVSMIYLLTKFIESIDTDDDTFTVHKQVLDIRHYVENIIDRISINEE